MMSTEIKKLLDCYYKYKHGIKALDDDEEKLISNSKANLNDCYSAKEILKLKNNFSFTIKDVKDALKNYDNDKCLGKQYVDAVCRDISSCFRNNILKSCMIQIVNNDKAPCIKKLDFMQELNSFKDKIIKKDNATDIYDEYEILLLKLKAKMN